MYSGNVLTLAPSVGPANTKESVTTMSAPKASVATSSTVLTSIAEGSITSASATTTISAPAITWFLALEFNGEFPLGYERGYTGTASSGMGFPFLGPETTPSSSTSVAATTTPTALTQEASLNTSSPVFTPAS
ncbi:hypothetical protein Hanom_Chr06g00518711 [Helianthus anomalus]